MAANARNVVGESNTSDTVDAFFEQTSNSDMTVTPDAKSTDDISVDAETLWTLADTASELGLSTRTILRRLKNGSLRGCKVPGANGPEWRIYPPTKSERDCDIVHPTVMTDRPHMTSTVDSTGDILLKLVAAQTEQLAAQSEQLKAASQVIMYQQSQLTDRDERIKLLEDKSRHPNLWQRFSSWVMGKKTD